MPKRSDWSSDLLSISIFAPLVIASRLQMLALQLVRPTEKGRRETIRMTAEKPIAAMEGAFAVQKQLFDLNMKFWNDLVRATNAFFMHGQAASLALAPVRRRVRGNARRLTGY